MRDRILLSAAASVFALSLLWSATGSKDATSWTFTAIDVPGADYTSARDMNPAGQIVGGYEIPEPYAYRGFLLSKGVFKSINVGAYNDARGINPDGEIIGAFDAWLPDGNCCALHGFLLSKGTTVTQIDYPGTDPIVRPDTDYTVAEGINAAGDVVGFYGLGGTEHGFYLSQGVYTTIDYPGATLTNARGINSEGDIVGLYTNDPELNGPYHGFRRSKHGTFTTIDGPGSPGGNANGINSRGEIVGEYGMPGDPIYHGFLLSQGEYTAINYPGATITRAWKITADGQHIVGFYDDLHGFVLSRKPLK
jgi:uncharacterized membrane protein